MDKLYAEGITSSNGVACMEFSFSNPSQHSYMEAVDQNSSSMRSSLSPSYIFQFLPYIGSYIVRTIGEVFAKDLS